MSGDARFALIIAVSAYASPDLDDLDAPHTDAARLAEVLRDERIGEFQDVEILLDPDVATARRAIERFFRARKPLDVAVLHFSGHAFRGERTDELYLACGDTSKDSPLASAIDGDFLRGVIERSRARRKLLLLDCCHSGALQLYRGPHAPAGPDAVTRTAEALSAGFARIAPEPAEPQSNATGTVIIGAARAAEVSEEAGTGVLTGAVVEGLSTGAADITRTGQISTENLFEYVTRWFETHELTQHPVVQQRSRSGRFIVARNCMFQPVLLPALVEGGLRDPDGETRREAVLRLQLLALTHDDIAEPAYRRLQHVAQFDLDDRVSEDARTVLAQLAPVADPPRLDFGTVDQDGPAATLTTRITAPHLSREWHPEVRGTAPVTTHRRGDDIVVDLHTTGTRGGRFYGSVAVESTTGVVEIPVYGRIRRAPRPDPLPLPRGGYRRLAVVPLALVVLLLLTTIDLRSLPAVLGACLPRDDLRVLTTDSLRDAVDEAAAGFAQPAADQQCAPVRITVATTTSDGVAQDRFAAGWPDDDLRVAGPSPDVWLPESSLRVALAAAALPADAPNRFDLPADPGAASVASSPLVLAVPETTAPPDPVDVSTVVDGPWVVPRADPRASTAGLLATVALYRRPPDEAERVLERGQGGDDSRYDLCAFRLSAEPPPEETAFLLPRKYIADYTAGRPLGGGCQAEQKPPLARGLRAVTVTGAPALDVPCVPIQDTAWGDAEQWELAGKFCDYLRRPEGREILKAHGLGPPAPSTGTAGATDATNALTNWTEAQRPVRVLLVMDVSGSMDLPMPGAAGATRLEAARDAAARTLGGRGFGSSDQIGLWEFATTLDGTRDYRQRVALAPASSDQQAEITRSLATLNATAKDTGLYDTISAGIDRLRQGRPVESDFAPVYLLVVLTDGENDDPGSTGLSRIAAQLDADERVHVAVIASVGANCRTFQPLLTERLGCFDANRDGLDAAFDKALPSRRGAP